MQKIIDASSPKFELWQQQLSEHLLAQYEPGSLSKEENERIFFQTNDLLIAIAQNFFTYGKFKDKWDTSKCSLYPFGQHLLLNSKKLNLNFQWGVDRNSFYLESYITHPDNLRYMKDEFFANLLVLKELGQFEYTGNWPLNAKERPYFENKNSTVFQMLRSYMLFQMQQMASPPNHYPQSHLNLGELMLKWDFDTDWAILLEQSCRAFKILYHLNYQLWKISNLAKKG